MWRRFDEGVPLRVAVKRNASTASRLLGKAMRASVIVVAKPDAADTPRRGSLPFWAASGPGTEEVA